MLHLNAGFDAREPLSGDWCDHRKLCRRGPWVHRKRFDSSSKLQKMEDARRLDQHRYEKKVPLCIDI